MHMIYLPFSDDLRHPEADPGFTGATNPQADKDQIAAAETMIHALNLKGFDSADIPNPSLQRHYQVSSLSQNCLFGLQTPVLLFKLHLLAFTKLDDALGAQHACLALAWLLLLNRLMYTEMVARNAVKIVRNVHHSTCHVKN